MLQFVIPPADSDSLRSGCCERHHVVVEESDHEATQLTLETLFDIRGAVYDSHDFLLGGEDDEEEETEEDS